jgi:hypothetical protein
MDEPDAIQVTRQELYDQVWSTPVSRLCRTYGFSDVGLANICDDWDIPRPTRGYWAKKRNGKRVAKKKLKTIEEGNPVIFWYKPGPPQEEKRPPTESQKQRALENRPENRIAVPDQLADPHPLVARTERSIRKAEPDESGIIRPQGSRCLNVAVAPAQIDRALRILDAVIKALEARGFAVSTVEGDRPRTAARVLGERVGFLLYEETKRQERKPTPEEKKKDAEWERFGDLWPIPKRYEWVPTGKLALQITDGYGLRRCWTDRSDRRVEQFLNSFVVGLVRAAETMKQQRVETERRQKEEEERNRRRQEEEQQQREQKRRQREEEARFQLLEGEAAAWVRAQQLRAYLAAVRATQEAHGGVPAGSALDDWLAWAESRVAALDPLTRPPAPQAGGGPPGQTVASPH